jgi:hypothetical protein
VRGEKGEGEEAMKKMYITKGDEWADLMEWLDLKGIDYEFEIIHPNLNFMRKIAGILPIPELRRIAFDVIEKISNFITKEGDIFIIKIEKRREVGESEL